MGPIELELRQTAESYRSDTGTNGTEYEFWAGVAGWSIGPEALLVLQGALIHSVDGEWTNEDSWSEAIECASELGL